MKFKIGKAILPRTRIPSLPYFDVLTRKLEEGHPQLETAFGRDVHWGYWTEPSLATGEPADYARAAVRLTHEICAAAQLAAGQSVLDTGCGFGGTVADINERLSPIGLTGLNIDPRQLARAREKVMAQVGNQIAFVEGDACKLPFPDASFDRVLAVEAIFHFPDRTRYFQEVSRVLKPGGRLALTDFVPAAWISPSLWLNVATSYYGDCDMRCTVGEYRRIAAASGLRPVIERNITRHTLPTYNFLKALAPEMGDIGHKAVKETRLLQLMSRLGLLRYMILAFEKI